MADDDIMNFLTQRSEQLCGPSPESEYERSISPTEDFDFIGEDIRAVRGQETRQVIPATTRTTEARQHETHRMAALEKHRLDFEDGGRTCTFYVDRGTTVANFLDAQYPRYAHLIYMLNGTG